MMKRKKKKKNPFGQLVGLKMEYKPMAIGINWELRGCKKDLVKFPRCFISEMVETGRDSNGYRYAEM